MSCWNSLNIYIDYNDYEGGDQASSDIIYGRCVIYMCVCVGRGCDDAGTRLLVSYVGTTRTPLLPPPPPTPAGGHTVVLKTHFVRGGREQPCTGAS